MSKPIVNTNPVANGYADSTERIVEFNSGVSNGPGGLISLRRTAAGKLQISLYRLDDNIEVLLSEDTTVFVNGEQLDMTGKKKG